MTIYYKSTEFCFSERALDFVKKFYTLRFQQNFHHGEDIDQETAIKKIVWKSTIVGKELANFLKNYSLDLDYNGITFFMCNLPEKFLGNPHIDSHGDSTTPDGNHLYEQSENSVVRSRFSVMIYGNPEDPMTWWNHVTYNDPALVYTKFSYINGTSYTAKNIPGNTAEERWAYLGKPSHVGNNFWTPSAFIKTDCAHTVTCSPGPRLMITVPLKRSLEEIFS